MNASDDATEPLGEAPELAATPHRTHLTDRQTQALKEIRALHEHSTYWSNCRECHDAWPCPTIRILERLGV